MSGIPSVGYWHWSIVCQRPTIGSKWRYGNYTLGLMIDSHPRFTTILLGLVFIEIGITREKRYS